MKSSKSSYDRIMNRSRMTDYGCFLCSYMKDGNGYPIVRCRNHLGKWSMTHASRVVYQFFNGPVSRNLVVMHTCDNRDCVNIDHLVIGTQKQNMEDAVAKNRMANGERNGSFKITDEQVEDIRSSAETKAKIAENYGISVRHVYYIIAKESRRDATHRYA